MSKVAALFVEYGGVYFGRGDVDPWDITRDARRYTGPMPVVAHPPCQRWGALGVANYARWGGEHNRPGNDGGCFSSALESVRKFGGVLEHPRGSLAWQAFNLHVPQPGAWTPSSRRDNEWTCEVWQSAYGHRANKATWLLYCGDVPPPELNWDRPIGTHQIGFQDSRGKAANKPTLSKREANATPIEFAELLINIAKSARKQRP